MKVTVYVRLLDEGTEVVRPTLAEEVAPSLYRLLPTQDYDPADEIWEFPPGSLIQLKSTEKGGVTFLLVRGPTTISTENCEPRTEN